MTNEIVFSRDLAGIEVGETHISDVKGEDGVLSYRGYAIESLAHKPFWQVVWLVLSGSWPDSAQEEALQTFMHEHSQLTQDEIGLLRAMPRSLHPMLMLQGIVPLLQSNPGRDINGLKPVAAQGLVIAAKLPTLVAAWRQLELGNEPLTANAEHNFHANFLRMFTGVEPGADQISMLDTPQILQMEHSFNAGTFAGRVCASTQAPVQSSISASIGTLYGVLHGGADQAALEMAKEIGRPELAEDFVARCLAEKRKIMGMGHREYKVVDPRAKILKPMAKTLCRGGEARNLFEILEAVEAACQREFAARGKEIYANVEFYKGAVFHQLGIPSHYFTAVFAMARVYGYIAHYVEFSENSCLIRPRARYVGKRI